MTPSGEGQQPHDARRQRRLALARAWAAAVADTTYVPMSPREIEEYLLALVDRIGDALSAEPFDPEPVAEIGTLLVRAHFSGPETLERTLDVLGRTLLFNPETGPVDRLAERVVTVLGAVASGYATAMRQDAFDQQEEIKRALLNAKNDVERVLKVSEARFRQVFATSAVGIAITDLTGRCVEANAALAEILATESSSLVGRQFDELLYATDTDGLHAIYRDLVDGVLDTYRERGRLRRDDGETAWVYLAVSVLRDADGNPTHHVTMVEDITELHLLADQLSHQALHDALTGLANRQYFASRLESALGSPAPITLYHLGLDAFSVVNHGLGHDVGDRLLKIVARRLEAAVQGERALVARISGDEFAVLVQHSPTTPSVLDMIRILQDELAEPVYLDDQGVAVSAGIGVVDQPPAGIEIADLLRAANSALRRAKANGKRQWSIYEQREDEAERVRSRLAAVLPGAWESGEISVAYQPMVRLTDGRIVGVEAVITWEHAEHGVVSPRDCMRLAEDTGLSLPIGLWALEAACGRAREWQDLFGDGAPTLWLRLTPLQSGDADLVGAVRQTLADTGLGPSAVRIALDTGAVLAELGDAADNLRVLADTGVGTALHEFGGAHQELGLLVESKTQALLLSPAVVREIVGNTPALRRALGEMVSVAHLAEGVVAAAGIDTAEQADRCRSIGVDLAQGAHFAPPLPPEQIPALLNGV
ncbi:EAL domain-containing protein [Solihabitans fulvus]|uniref:EAL domain-containing protein n=1 Tax=Solihabitans fulvus TaxID=1892852 RepID=A0A5B2XLT0_9PSEU|nr:EAL domain-containing protein [Solihabitans fulvus]KAA2264306.1 EAL domain-containing protein [Solihabitans fulvus]